MIKSVGVGLLSNIPICLWKLTAFFFYFFNRDKRKRKEFKKTLTKNMQFFVLIDFDLIFFFLHYVISKYVKDYFSVEFPYLKHTPATTM